GTTILEGSCLSFKSISSFPPPNLGSRRDPAAPCLPGCQRAPWAGRCKARGEGACREYPRFWRLRMPDMTGEQAGAGLLIVAGLVALGIVSGLAARLIPAIVAVPAGAAATRKTVMVSLQGTAGAYRTGCLLPLHGKSGLVGVLALLSQKPASAFRPEIPALEYYAAHTALAIGNSRLYGQVQEMFISSI